MRPTVFQRAELRDENDNIIQQGTYGKNSPLSNSTNDAWIDYVMNNLEALRSMSVGAVIPVETLPESGETGKAYVVTTGADAGKLFMWDGEDWVEITGSIGDYLPITGGTITGNLAVAGISTAVTPNADDNSTKVATTEYVQNEVKPIETDVDIAEKDIANIKALLQGHLYDYQTDSTSAYAKSVPSGAMPYAGLEKVGGKTIVYNQLMGTYTIGFTGLSRVADCIYNMNGTLGSAGYCVFGNGLTYTGHKYYLAIKGYASTTGHAISVYTPSGSLGLTSNSIDTFRSTIQTQTADASIYLRYDADTYNNVTTTVKVFDLTLMFGAGNEPSTTAEFEAMFPVDTYPFSTGTLLSAGVTSVVSKDSNNATLQTYPIPASIQALEGYGWSAGTAYNYVDFERKVFVQNVGKIILNGTHPIATVNLAASSNGVGWAYRTTNLNIDNLNHPASPSLVANVVSNRFVANKETLLNAYEYGIAVSSGSNWAFYIRQSDTSLTTETAINNYLSANPLTIYYELATPIETDISAYLTDDNLINVEADGTLTFPNQNGTDYQIPVPSEETYMIDLQSAIGE